LSAPGRKQESFSSMGTANFPGLPGATTINTNYSINRTPSFFTDTIGNIPSMAATSPTYSTNSYSLTTALSQE